METGRGVKKRRKRLTQNKNNVAAVVASNDGTAGGAIQALGAQGLAGKVIVTGQDAELAALQRIAKGTQSMTVYKPIQPLAYGAVELAVKLAKGQPTDAKDKIQIRFDDQRSRGGFIRTDCR